VGEKLQITSMSTIWRHFSARKSGSLQEKNKKQLLVYFFLRWVRKQPVYMLIEMVQEGVAVVNACRATGELQSGLLGLLAEARQRQRAHTGRD
jgi:hypothetical protein